MSLPERIESTVKAVENIVLPEVAVMEPAIKSVESQVVAEMPVIEPITARAELTIAQFAAEHRMQLIAGAAVCATVLIVAVLVSALHV